MNAHQMLPFVIVPVMLAVSIFLLAFRSRAAEARMIELSLFWAMLIALTITAWLQPAALISGAPVWAGSFALALASLSWPSLHRT